MKKILYFLVIIAIIFNTFVLFTGCSNSANNETVATEATNISTVSPETETVTVNSSEIITETKTEDITQKDTNSDEVTLDKAKQIALNHAGMSESSVTFTKTKLDTDDGVKIYEVDFTADNIEYEYDIDAKTGSIISSEKDTEKVSATASDSDNQTSVLIPSSQATRIALVDAGVTENEAAIEPVDLDAEDGVQYYDVKFRAGSIEYEYEINAKTGEIIASDKD